jgi:acetate kinase
MGDSTELPAQSQKSRSVLAVNSGSSSIKFALFTFGPGPTPLCRGSVDRPDNEDELGTSAFDALIERVAESLEKYPLAAIGHRVVHGGPGLRDPQVVTDELVGTLRQLVRFAPNHLPDEIQLIEAMRQRRPATPQIVCFDTAFHADLPDVARSLAIPRRYANEGVRRYGFHGLSYTFLLDELRHRAGSSTADGHVILAHLGNGSSLAAVRGGRSIDTSMGFTPIGGLVMSTRSGDLDPGVVTYIARTTGFDADRVERELSHHSGLFALSGGFADMRELLARESTDASCRLAAAVYCYEIKKRIGAYAAALGGLDALVFSGGIGEHAPAVRARICDGLDFLGFRVDLQKNQANAPIISVPDARITIHVIPTDEEVVIARAAYRLLH